MESIGTYVSGPILAAFNLLRISQSFCQLKVNNPDLSLFSSYLRSLLKKKAHLVVWITDDR